MLRQDACRMLECLKIRGPGTVKVLRVNLVVLKTGLAIEQNSLRGGFQRASSLGADGDSQGSISTSLRDFV
jgi:hypothetical protein